MFPNTKIEDKLGLRFFFNSKTPTPPPPPKAPAPSAAASNVQQSTLKSAKKHGFSSTFLTGLLGVTNQDSKKPILGG